MQRNCLYVIGIMFCIATTVADTGYAEQPAVGEETEILNITVGEATKISDLVYQNTASLSVSRTGVVAVFYAKPNHNPRFYRVSTDGGQTWSKEMAGPGMAGGAESVGLRDGGVFKPQGGTVSIEGERDWYDLTVFRFTDDFMSWETETDKMYVPNHITALSHVYTPNPAKGKILQMPDGALLMPMGGRFSGDVDVLRAYLVRSIDEGRTWLYYVTINYTPQDPNPELPGQYAGFDEQSFVLLPNGQMLAILRTQYSHLAGEYRPLYVCWSNDLGRTWSKPTPTKPHLMNIWPTLQLLDNGVVACQYGRPGFHVAFSLDNGHTWQDRITFSDLPEPFITGQFDMIKTGPNRLVAVGSDAEGIKVWPITVELLKVSPAHVALEGRVLDQQGTAIAGATVERSPNRYYLDSWLEHPTELDPWKKTPLTIGSPALGYRSIRKEDGYPTVQTDAQGQFQFESVKLGEYVLTVEADGYAPQHRHIKVSPESKPQDFRLKHGRKIRSRVVDDTGQPVSGACVVLNRWHVHTDLAGFFHWSVESPLPEQVAIMVYKRYSGHYEILKATVSFSQLERQPIALKNR